MDFPDDKIGLKNGQKDRQSKYPSNFKKSGHKKEISNRKLRMITIFLWN